MSTEQNPLLCSEFSFFRKRSLMCQTASVRVLYIIIYLSVISFVSHYFQIVWPWNCVKKQQPSNSVMQSEELNKGSLWFDMDININWYLIMTSPKLRNNNWFWQNGNWLVYFSFFLYVAFWSHPKIILSSYFFPCSLCSSSCPSNWPKLKWNCENIQQRWFRIYKRCLAIAWFPYKLSS